MALKKIHWIGIVSSLVLVALSFVFLFNGQDLNLFWFMIGVSVVIFSMPFVFDLIGQNKKEQQISDMFLEFSRNLAESVATGTPISKSIINMRKKNYGSLTPHIQKLANQIELGISVNRALQTFANDVGSRVIRRAVALINEAERAGGDIDYILESTARSISEIEKLKKERRAAISNLVVQGYIIFFIFIGIMLVMEFKILPLVAGAGSFGDFSGLSISSIGAIGGGGEVGAGGGIDTSGLARPFLYLLLVQGFFAGLVIGKIAEGSLKAGIKHSFILVITSFLISSGARLFLG